MAFDPNLPNDVKQGLKGRPRAPSYFDAALNSPYMMGGGNGMATHVAQQVLANADPAAAAPATTPSTPAPNNQVELDPGDAAYPHGSIQSNGLRALPQGVVRSSIPGVYLARGKDGSFMASNVVGANGSPDFGGGTAANAAAAGVAPASLRRPGGTSYDPRMAITDADGYTMAPGAQGGTYDPNAGAVDTSGAASLPGAASGPTGGFTYAQNSLHMNPADMITAAGINPEAADQAKQQLIASMNNDPNASNPEVAEANRAALAQLQGNVQDVRQQYWGSNGGMYGAMGGGGGTGTAGAKGGIGLRDILTNRYRNANLAERAARDETRTGIEQQQANRAAAAEKRQDAQYLMTNFQNAETKTPGSGANLIAQSFPQGKTQSQYEDYFTNDPKGQAVQAMLLQELQNGAATSLWPGEHYDKVNLGQNVNFGNMKLDKSGNFAGFYDEDGVAGGSNEYPRKSVFGNPNYNERLISSISPSAWKALQQIGLHRSAQ